MMISADAHQKIDAYLKVLRKRLHFRHKPHGVCVMRSSYSESTGWGLRIAIGVVVLVVLTPNTVGLRTESAGTTVSIPSTLLGFCR